MKETLIQVRNSIFSFKYRYILKPLFFLNDPEEVHDGIIHVGSYLGKFSLGQKITKIFFNYENKVLEQTILGIDFKNPIGLAAGFDKNAELTAILPYVGFGFEEIGSVTGEYCEGNPKPRLWRLKKSKSLVVWYGLKNNGCENIFNKLKDITFTFPVGVSVAMTNNEHNGIVENAIQDFAKAFTTLESLATYITVNISCPNTCAGQPFLDPINLELLLTKLDTIETKKPIFVKLSPDLSEELVIEILEVLKRHRVHGIIATNLTKKRNNKKIIEVDIPVNGGLSGKVVEDLSNELISFIYKREGNRFVLIGCGGVFTAADAYKKIRLGASLIQLATGMIFEGPQVISSINQGLVKLLQKDGFRSLSEAIGADNKR